MLGWKLISYKLMYYYPEKVHKDWHKELTVPDSTFDTLEQRYLDLCVELGQYNTVVYKRENVLGDGMFELDFDRPSVKLVLSKYSKSKEALRRHVKAIQTEIKALEKCIKKMKSST